MNNELNNFFENKNYQRTRNLIPHNSRLNNYKSNRYFTIDDNTNLMKEALTKYRESQQKSEKNDFTNNKSLHSNASTADITKISKGKQKFNKNNTIKLDKNILYFAEKSKRIQQFHKINPKVIESITIDDLENYNEKETINENNNNNKEKRNIIYKKSRINDYNKNLKLQKNKKKFDVTIDMSNNDETVINENDEDESETIFYESEYQKVDNSISNNNYNNLNSNPNITKLFNANDINFEYLLMIEKLFGDLTKDIEVNKMEKYINKLAIIKDFLYIFNDEDGFKILDRIDSIIMKDNNNIFLMIKEYLIEQLIFFYTIIIIELIKKDKNNFYSGLHSLIFYFHQNFIIFLNLIITNIIISSEQRENIYKKNECIKIINENKTWLDKTDFKEYLFTNNKISKQTLINLLNQIKSYFQTNNNNIQNSPFKRMNQNKITDTIINLFLTRITNPKSPKLSDLVKELKTFPSINYLLESLNINKISSNYSSEQNQEQEVYEFDSEEENPNENDNLVFNIIENDTEKTIRQDKEQTPKKFYLNPINPKYKYTLVLDLDETLVHYISDNESAYIQIRPGAENFLKELSEFYEIVIFTAALQTYADLVIEGIDPDGVVSYRLYRQHTINVGNVNIKDLDKLGRDIKRVIIIDNFLENYSLHPRNGLNIIDFEGNEYDDELEYLKDDLLKLVKLNPDDVRPYLTDIQRGMDKRAIYFQKIINENQDKEEEYIIDKDNKNNLFNDILNNNNNYNDERKNTESKNINNKKGYSFTEESDII